MNLKKLLLRGGPESSCSPLENESDSIKKGRVVDLGNGSQVVYTPMFLGYDESWRYFEYLNLAIPWTRPTIRVFGRSCVQVHKALPGSKFNSLLLNRYKSGHDYVGWHADDEKLYGDTPDIASLSFGCEREFLLKTKKPRVCRTTSQASKCDDEPASKRLKRSSLSAGDRYSFTLKHGSLLVMRGNTQMDWVHSVPKRVKSDAMRINLTFRHVL